MSLVHHLKRHWSIFSIHVIDVFQFRLRALVWFLVGSVNTIILLLFWIATLQASQTGTETVSLPYITSYYILLLSLATVSICHIEEDIAYRDIYQGNIHGYLLRPYSYIGIKFQQEIVWRFMAGFWALLTVLILSSLGFSFSITSNPLMIVIAILSILFGTLTSFFLKVTLGLVSVWTTNIRGVMDLYTILEILLAGFIIPLSLFPESVRFLVHLTPLATFVYFPVQILTTSPDISTASGMIALQVFWLLFFFMTSRWIFSKALRQYTGVSQ